MEFYLIYKFDYKSKTATASTNSQELTKNEKDIIINLKKTICFKHIISLKQTLSDTEIYEKFQNKMYIRQNI